MIFDADSSILVVVCRRPTLGVGKQRIATSLGNQRALEISELLLAAAIEDALHWPEPVVIAPASAADEDWATTLMPDATIIPQIAGSLGTRIQHVDEQVRRQGGQNILFIGSDAPALTPAMLETAAISLQTHDVVLIPARDGGVTLMGCANPWPDLTELPWESPQLAYALQTACAAHKLTIALLPESYDIDTRDDLAAALTDLKADPRITRRQICSWIATVLTPKDSISAIIPVLDDLPALDSLLMHLANMRGEVAEVIVVDGGADPECETLCALRKAHYIKTAACRGQQLVLGAEYSTSEILWFLHADSEPPNNAPECIREHIQFGFGGGFFRFRFLGEPRWHKTLLQWAINLRTRFGIPYSDQGLFAHRKAYEQAGGFSATPLFEEVQLVRELRRQSGFCGVQASIGVSPRRWERDGWLKRSLHNRYLALAYMLGVAPEKLAKQYQAVEQTD